jgi:hypothetical protein
MRIEIKGAQINYLTKVVLFCIVKNNHSIKLAEEGEGRDHVDILNIFNHD